MEPFLRIPVRSSTSITSPLSGAVYLVADELPTIARKDSDMIQRDSVGASLAFRLTTYVVRMLSLPNVLLSLDVEQRESLFYYLPLALQFIDDDVSIEGSIGMIGLEFLEDRDIVLDTISQGYSIIGQWLRSDARLSDAGRGVSNDLLKLWEVKIGSIDDLLPESYRVGQAFAKIMSDLESTMSSDTLTSLARELRKYNPIRAAAELAVWGPVLASSPSGTRLCNELIADATGFKPEKGSEGK